MSEKNRTSLTFLGKPQGVKINTPKDNGGYTSDGKVDAGSIDVTFRVEAPRAPRKPMIRDWELTQARNKMELLGGKEPGEDDPKSRKAWAEAVKTIKAYEAQQAAEMAKYERQLAAHAPALMQYAQLVGLMAVFGSRRLVINIQPADQDLLPGMGVALALTDGTDGDEDGVP